VCIRPPFSGQEPMDIYNAILKGVDIINYPKQMNKMTQALVKQLCRSDPTERIGYQKGGIQDIRRHEYLHFFIIINSLRKFWID